MAKIIRRTWTTQGPTGKRVRHTAYGYTLMANGRQERKTSSDWLTEAAAFEALTARQKEIGAGIVDRGERSLGELTEEYLAYKADQGKRSVVSDRRILKGRVLPAIGAGLPVRSLTGARIAQYERARMAATATGRARKVSAYTVANELAVLRHMLRLARRWGYVDQVPEIVLPKKPEGRLRYLEAEEIGKLLEACRQSRNPYLLCIVTLAINTGMRKGEILGLEWARVDLSSARITLYRTKSGKPRGVPINSAVYEALIRFQPDASQRTGLIFRKGDNREWGQIRTAFEAALTRAGVAGFRFHDLRHTAASHLVMRGATLQEVKEILGHADLTMTVRYAHLSPAHLRSAVERLEGLTAVPAAPAAAPSAHESAQSTPRG